MNKKTLQEYKFWFLLSAALSVPVLLYAVISGFPAIWKGIGKITGFFYPVILGIIIAYLVDLPASFYRRTILRGTGRHKDILSNTLAFITVFLFFGMIMLYLTPQLIDGVKGVIGNLNRYIEKVNIDLPQADIIGLSLDADRYIAVKEKIVALLVEMTRKSLYTMLETSVTAGKSLLHWLFALFLSMYLLAEKEKLKDGACLLMKAMLSGTHYESAVVFLNRCHSIIKLYVAYNLLDSLIVGGANALFLTLMGVPYAGLLSFICAVTNLIPTFGPVVGGDAEALHEKKLVYVQGIH